MKRSTLGIIVAVVALLGIGGVVALNNKDNDSQRPAATTGMGDTSHDDGDSHSESEMEDMQAPAGENEVNIVDFNFSPETMTIKKGTTVTWTNQDDARHDITPDEESEFFQASELLAKGETYSFTFNEVGTYAYHCSPHPYMTATIEVTE